MPRVKDEELIKALGDQVRAIRLTQSLTMEQLAERCQLDYRQIARVEHGEINSSISMVNRIAEGLGLSLGELFSLIQKQP